MNWQAGNCNTTCLSRRATDGQQPASVCHIHPPRKSTVDACLHPPGFATLSFNLYLSFCVSPLWSQKALPCALLAFFSTLLPMLLTQRVILTLCPVPQPLLSVRGSWAVQHRRLSFAASPARGLPTPPSPGHGALCTELHAFSPLPCLETLSTSCGGSMGFRVSKLLNEGFFDRRQNLWIKF